MDLSALKASSVAFIASIVAFMHSLDKIKFFGNLMLSMGEVEAGKEKTIQVKIQDNRKKIQPKEKKQENNH